MLQLFDVLPPGFQYVVTQWAIWRAARAWLRDALAPEIGLDWSGERPAGGPTADASTERGTAADEGDVHSPRDLRRRE